MATALANKKQKQKWDQPEEMSIGKIMAPFLDMAFQLLFFFVINFHPSALEGHIDGKLLPPDKVAIFNPDQQEKDTSTELEPEVKTEITLKVESTMPGQDEGTTREGDPTRIRIKTPEDTEPQLVADQLMADGQVTLTAALQKLEARLKEIKNARQDEKLVIKLQPDGNLRHSYVVTVWNVCKAAVGKDDKINFVAPASMAKK